MDDDGNIQRNQFHIHLHQRHHDDDGDGDSGNVHRKHDLGHRGDVRVRGHVSHGHGHVRHGHVHHGRGDVHVHRDCDDVRGRVLL